MGKFSDGVQMTVDYNPSGKWGYHEDSANQLTDVQVQPAPGAGLSVFVSTLIFSLGAAVEYNVFLEEGASKILGPFYVDGTKGGRGVALRFNPPKQITENTALTISTSAAQAHSIDITGFIGPST